MRWSASLVLSWMALSSVPAQAQEACSIPYSDNSAIERLCAAQEGFAAFMIRGAWGFMDRFGKVVIEPQFHEAKDFSEGLAAVNEGGLWGFVDVNGKRVTPIMFGHVGAYSGGLAAAREREDGNWGYIDRDGEWAIAPAYDHAGPFQGDTAMVSVGNSSMLIDRHGQVLKRFEDDLDISEVPNAWGLYRAERKGERFVWRRDGSLVPLPGQAAPFLREVGDGPVPTEETRQKGEAPRWGAMDPQGRWIVPARFASLEPFHDGLAVAGEFPRALDAGGTSADARSFFGLIDQQGTFVLPPRYERITRMAWGGYAAVHADNGGIDIVGKGGKILLSAAICADLDVESNQPDRNGANSPRGVKLDQWSVVTGCGKSWAFHARAGMVQSQIASPSAVASDTHLMLVSKRREADDDPSADSASAPLQFDIFDTSGRRTFSSDDSAMQGDRALSGPHDYVFLLPSSGESADRGRLDLLPLALVTRRFKDVQAITREGKLVSNPEWIYESNLLDYQYPRLRESVEGPMVVHTDDGWGAIDGRGKWVIQPRYRQLSSFKDGVAFAQDDDDQWVLIEYNGKTHVLPKDGYRFARVAPGVFMGRSRDMAEERSFFRVDLSTGQASLVKMPGYVDTDRFHEGLASAQVPGEQAWGLVDDRGEWVVPPRFDTSFDPVMDSTDRLIGWRSGISFQGDDSRSYLYGWFDTQGRERVTPSYSAIDYDDEHGILKVTRNHRFHGLMAPDGTLLLAAQYQEIQSLEDSGAFVVTGSTLNGFIDAQGAWAAPLSPVDFPYGLDRPYVLKRDGAERVLVDIHGRRSTASAPLALSPKQDDSPQWWWSDTMNAYRDDETTVFYGSDFRERMRIPGQVPWYARFSEGVIAFTPRGHLRGRVVALADAQGNVLGRYPYESIDAMTEGLAMFVQKVAVPARKGKATGDDGAGDERTRAGYLDRTGKIAITPTFDSAGSFSEGRAVVLDKGNLGLIDTRGKLVAHSAWLCAREPVVLDASGRVQWPATVAKKTRC